MNDRYFDFEALEPQIAGAGILPISMSNNKFKILLGKERYINHWRGSLKWSGFEGGRKPTENVINTACREFIEESLGVVSIENDMFDFESYQEQIQNIIVQKKYFMRIILCINHENENSIEKKRYHVTYVIEVPYNVSYIEKFDQSRSKIVDLFHKLSQFQKLQEQINYVYPFIKEGNIVQSKQVKSILNVHVSNESLVVHFTDEDDNKKSIFSTDFSNETSLYEKWWLARISLHEDVKYFDSLQKALIIKYNDANIFENATINDEFMEKQQIAWWDIDDLKEVMKNGGFFKNDFFRAYFIPVLQRTIQELNKYHPNGNDNEKLND